MALVAFWVFEAWFSLGWPGLGVVAAQLAIVVVLDDVWFYWMHRWMHRQPGLYRRIHKQHHEAFAPVPIEYIYVHPLELAAGTVGTFLVWDRLLGTEIDRAALRAPRGR